jgi:DNA-binding transcriptional LysR family regulator
LNQRVVGHELDLGLTEGLVEEEELEAEVFHRDELVLIAAPGHRLAGQNSSLMWRSKSTRRASLWLSPIGFLCRFGRKRPETPGIPAVLAQIPCRKPRAIWEMWAEVSRGMDKWLWFVEAHLQAER